MNTKILKINNLCHVGKIPSGEYYLLASPLPSSWDNRTYRFTFLFGNIPDSEYYLLLCSLSWLWDKKNFQGIIICLVICCVFYRWFTLHFHSSNCYKNLVTLHKDSNKSANNLYQHIAVPFILEKSYLVISIYNNVIRIVILQINKVLVYRIVALTLQVASSVSRLVHILLKF